MVERSAGGASRGPQDSAPDTLDHIVKVGMHLAAVVQMFTQRAAAHDRTKLMEPEKPAYDRARAALDAAEYGSPEYKAATDLLGPALDHHFANNRHHPEFFGEGVDGMSLIDVVEMVCDWKAASQRRPGVDVRDGLSHNFDKYGIDPQLAKIIENTVETLWPTQ